MQWGGDIVDERRVVIEKRQAIAVREVGQPARKENTVAPKMVEFDHTIEMEQAIGTAGGTDAKKWRERRKRKKKDADRKTQVPSDTMQSG